MGDKRQPVSELVLMNKGYIYTVDSKKVPRAEHCRSNSYFTECEYSVKDPISADGPEDDIVIVPIHCTFTRDFSKMPAHVLKTGTFSDRVEFLVKQRQVEHFLKALKYRKFTEAK